MIDKFEEFKNIDNAESHIETIIGAIDFNSMDYDRMEEVVLAIKYVKELVG